jgi:hypothetical protein
MRKLLANLELEINTLLKLLWVVVVTTPLESQRLELKYLVELEVKEKELKVAMHSEQVLKLASPQQQQDNSTWLQQIQSQL